MDQTLLGPADRWITLPRYIPKYTLGWGAIKWGMKYLRQPDGDNAGSRWKFTESQIRFLLHWYALDENAQWVYSHGVRRLPKGAGKSPFAAVMSILEFCGPVRFAKWVADPDNPGDAMPVGKPVGMPLVEIAATAESQGLINTMTMVTALIAATNNDGSVDHKKKSRLILDYGLDVGKTQINKPGGGFLHVITSSASAAEGARTTFGICDQTEAWIKSNGGHKLFEVMDRNAAKSKSRLVQTANAWEPGSESIAERTFDAWVDAEEGRQLGTARTLMDVRQAPPDTVRYSCAVCGAARCDHGAENKVIDRDKLVEGVTEAYGDCYWSDAVDIVDRHILDLKTPFAVSKRFYLNWPTVSEEAWCEPQEWNRWADPSLILADGVEIALGFDGSRANDATALIACEITTGNIFDLGIWETKPLEGGGRLPIPVTEVDAAVERAFERWNPVAFFADVREWESFVKVTWPERYSSRLKIMAAPGTYDPQPIAWDMRVRTNQFTGAAEMVHEEVCGDEAVFKHDGSAMLAKHVKNMRNRPNKFGTSVGKESPDSPNKIDAGVAMIIARHARRMYLSTETTKAAKAKPKSSAVYSFS
jgi:hypothetical protein